MSMKRLVVALLLLTMVTDPAAAADSPEHKSKNARKILIVLGALGVNNSEVKHLVEQADTYVKDGYLTLSQREIPGGKLTLRYELSMGIGVKKVELHYAPDNSNWQAIARTDRVILNYRYRF